MHAAYLAIKGLIFCIFAVVMPAEAPAGLAWAGLACLAFAPIFAFLESR